MLTTAEGSSDRFEPFFLQNVFFICIPEPQKKFGQLFLCFTPPKETFFFIGGAWLARFPELRACPHFWKSAALGNHIGPRWEYRPDHFSGIEGMPSFLEKCSRWSFLVMATTHINAQWTCELSEHCSALGDSLNIWVFVLPASTMLFSFAHHLQWWKYDVINMLSTAMILMVVY